jgi:FkbM family methyltransferase
VQIRASIAGALSLWQTARAAGLDAADRVRYAASYYLSRRALLRFVAPLHFSLKLTNGMRVLIRPNGVDHRTMKDIFVHRTYDLALNARDVNRVLDLGANIGMATLFFASQFPSAEFACVEPSPENRAVLQKALAINRIRATVFNGVVGTESGTADLYVDCDSDEFSVTPAKKSSLNKLQVRQYTLPEILATLGWDKVDLLKIDIEGQEKTLFRTDSEWLSHVRLIIGEAHGHVGYGIEEVHADLDPLGFEVTQKTFDKNNGLTIFEARNRRMN